MRAEISIPLDQVLPVVGKGRYVNGADTFDVRLGADGFPRVQIVSAQVNGKRLPRWVERPLGRKELHQDIFQVLREAGEELAPEFEGFAGETQFAEELAGQFSLPLTNPAALIKSPANKTG